MPAKRWRTVYTGSEPDSFTSKRLAYEFVEALRRSWVAGAPGCVGSLTVQTNDGSGWTEHEYINFAEESAA